jgi:hypothetical protein
MDWLDVVSRSDASIALIKTRDRDATGTQVQVGMAEAQLAG